jgi:WD40 repeat protein
MIGVSQFIYKRLEVHPKLQEAICLAVHARLIRLSLAGSTESIITNHRTNQFGLSILSASGNGDLFAVGSQDETFVNIHQWSDLKLIHSLEFTARIAAIDFSQDGRWIAIATNNEQIHLLDFESKQIKATIEGGERTLRIRFDPHSKYLAAACSFQGGGHIGIYQIDVNGKALLTNELDRSNVHTPDKEFVDTLVDLTFSLDGQYLALFETSGIYHEKRPRGWRGDLVLYQFNTGQIVWQVHIDKTLTGDKRSLEKAGYPMGFFTQLLFIDNDAIACGSTNGRILFFDVRNGSLIRSAQVHPEAAVEYLALERVGNKLVGVLSNGQLFTSNQVSF